MDPEAAPQKAAEHPSEDGAQGRLFSKDRSALLPKRVKDKLGKTSTKGRSGIDAEMLALGTELAVYHIEAGARSFRDFAKAIASNLGAKLGDLKPFLRGWYGGARDLLEDSGHDIAGTDNPDTVRVELGLMLADEKMRALQDEYTWRAKDHWKKWLPKMTKDMRAAGKLDYWAQKAGEMAAAQVTTLMRHGLQRHEAEEIVLPETIILPPEQKR